MEKRVDARGASPREPARRDAPRWRTPARERGEGRSTRSKASREVRRGARVEVPRAPPRRPRRRRGTFQVRNWMTRARRRAERQKYRPRQHDGRYFCARSASRRGAAPASPPPRLVRTSSRDGGLVRGAVPGRVGGARGGDGRRAQVPEKVPRGGFPRRLLRPDASVPRPSVPRGRQVPRRGPADEPDAQRVHPPARLGGPGRGQEARHGAAPVGALPPPIARARRAGGGRVLVREAGDDQKPLPLPGAVSPLRQERRARDAQRPRPRDDRVEARAAHRRPGGIAHARGEIRRRDGGGDCLPPPREANETTEDVRCSASPSHARNPYIHHPMGGWISAGKHCSRRSARERPRAPCDF